MHRLLVTAGVAAAVCFAGSALAQPPSTPPGQAKKATVLHPDHHDVTPPLREMKKIPPGHEKEESPHAPMPVHGRATTPPGLQDGALQTDAPGAHAIHAASGFEGIGNGDGVLPPDTNGDVGPNHYIQWVNLTFAIYDKQGHVLEGPESGRTLWQGFGGPCEADNDGDPIVLYDEAADRWLMSQFALPNYPSGPYYQCIAVSQSANPTGAWARYSYSFSKMNDYPKFGVWPDGYYMSVNQFANGSTFAGAGVAAFDRVKMLAGAPADMVFFDTKDTSLGGMLPADVDGTPPASGTPEYFVQFDDSPNQLELWEFKVDWANTSNSTFTRRASLATSAFNSNLCNYSRNCIPQPGRRSPKIDALSDRLMYRLQYRKFADHESLVTNHSVNVGSNRAGVRWYEIRNPHTAPVIFQQGTFAPADTLNRWMGSVAMDKDGNLGVGYSVSNSTTYPSIRFSGRLAADPPDGTLTVTETDLQAGSGAQTHSSGRWGDYSMLAVDPSDGCTFWYTTEYYASSSSAGWHTNVGSFKLGSCGGGTAQPPARPTGLSATAVSTSQINLQWNDNSSDETGFSIERCTGAGCSNFTALATVGPNVKTYSNTGLSSATSYSYRVRAVNGTLASDPSDPATAVTQAPQTDTQVWVTALAPSSATNGKVQWRATATITAGNSTGAKSGVTVSGSWQTGGTGSCVTDSTGRCSITSGKISTQVASTTFTVTSLASSTLTYNAANNANGGSVIVNKPQ
jgi:hypothetical protein